MEYPGNNEWRERNIPATMNGENGFSLGQIRPAERASPIALGALLFSIGFFTLIAQAALAREFLVLYLGSEIALGVFYAAWLGWIGAGAAAFLPLARRGFNAARWLPAALAALPPAALVELALLRWSRFHLGVSAAELVPFGKLAWATCAVTAWIGVPAGFAFSLACRAVDQAAAGKFAAGGTGGVDGMDGMGGAGGVGGENDLRRKTGWVGLLFGLEALGGFAGGLLYTFLLVERLSPDAVFWLLAGLVGAHLVVWMVFSRRTARWSWLFLGLAFAAGGTYWVAAPSGKARLGEKEKERFERAREGFEEVARCESRYERLELARRKGQYTLFANGGVAFSFPDPVDNLSKAALVMAQRPGETVNVLLLGAAESGLVPELLEYPGLRRLDVVSLNPRVSDLVRPYLDARDRAALEDPRVVQRHADPRAFVNLSDQKDFYDLVIVEAPDSTAASVNRLFTVEFYEKVRGLLRSNGVLATEVTAATHYFGRDVGDYAGSVAATAHAVFPNVALAPGDRMTILASAGEVTVDAAVLAERYRVMGAPGAAFRPESFFTLLPEEQVRRVRERFQNASAPINRDARPITYYLGIILWSRFSGSDTLRAFLRATERAGIGFLLVPLLIALAARLLYVGLDRRPGIRERTDRVNAVATVGGLGCIGMVASMMLILAYQCSVGFLYGRIGLLAGLFMIGLGAAAFLTRQAAPTRVRARAALLAALLMTALLLLFFRGALLQPGKGGEAFIMIGLGLAGALVGAGFAAAARVFADAAGRTGAWLEAADHAGGAIGALATGGVAVPLLGFQATALLGAAAAGSLLLLNAQAAWMERREEEAEAARPLRAADKDFSRALFWMLAALCLGAYTLGRLAHPAATPEPVRIASSQLPALPAPFAWKEKNDPFFHWETAAGDQRRAVFATDQTAPDVRGFAGPITLLLDLDGQNLREARLLRSDETPSYTSGLSEYLKKFSGKPLQRAFQLGAGIDGITGATVTSQAVIETINRSIYRGGRELLGLDLDPEAWRQASWKRHLLSPSTLLVALCFVLFVPVYFGGGDRVRFAFLVGIAAVLGFALNRAFTLLDVGNASLGRWPSAVNAAGAILLGGVCLLTLLWGCVFCGYLCPFGALQEIVARVAGLTRDRFLLRGRLREWRAARYAVAAVALSGFWLSWGDPRWTAWCPLQTFFAARKDAWLWFGGGVALVVTLATPRLWCLYLCPPGAVLSLWNRFALLRGTRFFRRPDYGACDLGASPERPRDCLRCNRCLVMKEKPRRPVRAYERTVAAAFLIAFTALAVVCWNMRQTTAGAGTPVSTETSARARDLNVPAVDEALRSGRLSDREAMFYEVVPEKGAPGEGPGKARTP